MSCGQRLRRGIAYLPKSSRTSTMLAIVGVGLRIADSWVAQDLASKRHQCVMVTVCFGS
jgi:hypothetical protein